MLTKDSAAASERDPLTSGSHFDIGEGTSQSWREAHARCSVKSAGCAPRNLMSETRLLTSFPHLLRMAGTRNMPQSIRGLRQRPVWHAGRCRARTPCSGRASYVRLSQPQPPLHQCFRDQASRYCGTVCPSSVQNLPFLAGKWPHGVPALTSRFPSNSPCSQGGRRSTQT